MTYYSNSGDALTHPAEALLHEITERMPIAVFQYVRSEDGTNRVTYASPSAFKLFGVVPEAAVADMGSVFKQVLPEYLPGMLHWLEERYRSLDNTPYEFRFRNPRDGRIMWVMSQSNPTRLPDGSVKCNGYWADITQRKALEDELLAAQESAISAASAKATFLARMSHEIRTPTNAILGFAHLLRNEALNERQQSLLDKVDKAAGSLIGVINNVLDFSKINAGKMEVDCTAFRLEDLIEGIVTVNEQGAADKGLRLARHIAPDVPRQVCGDPFRLGQVLTNLVNNAVKYSDRGEVSVLVTRSRRKGHYDIQVRDEGDGMTPEQCAQLFQPYSQVAPSISRRHGGTGLGLSISKELTALMGGTLSVRSTPGEGSTFSIHLPLGTHDAPKAPEAPSNSGPRPDFSGKTVLVADDSEFNRILAVELLAAVHADVLLATNGQEVIETLSTHPTPIHAILMDVQMPVLDGFDTTRLLRSDPRFAHLPVIALTAAASAEDRDQCLAAGIDAHIAKPIEPEWLYQLLEQWLR